LSFSNLEEKILISCYNTSFISFCRGQKLT